MKDSQKQNRPDDLSKVLREWRADASLPPGFQANVWRRIDASSAQSPKHSLSSLVVGWFGQFVAKPQMAAAYIALLVTIGMTVGWTQGKREVSKVESRLAQTYIATLDPYQPGR